MKVGDLIKLLQDLPPDIDVEVNDNLGGEVYSVDDVSYFDDMSPPLVIIQVNCE